MIVGNNEDYQKWHKEFFNTLKEKLNKAKKQFILNDKIDFAIEELEKLKAEFEEDRYILLNQTVAIKVLEKRIEELKGE